MHIYPEKAVTITYESGEDSMTKPQIVRSRLRRFWSDWGQLIIAMVLLVLSVIARGYT